MSHNHGTSSSSDSSSTIVMMIPWLHVDGGDTLFFKSLHPSSAGALAGASIVLFLLAVLQRWLSAMRGVMERKWRQRALDALQRSSGKLTAPLKDETTSPCCDGSEDISAESHKPDTTSEKSGPPPRHPRMFAPFILSNDVARGAMHTVQALLDYTLMLAVMTFHAAYIISIIAGAGVGEMLFGRWQGVDSHH